MKTKLCPRIPLVPALAALALLGTTQLVAGYAFVQTNLVSDQAGHATFTDPNLVNAWGISRGPTSPWWVSNNGTGTSTLYNGNTGAPLPLVVSIPTPSGGLAAPTGQVFNGGSAFNGDRFLFASEDGLISGWRGALGTTAETLFASTDGAIYKGLAISSMGADTYLYAADFHNNHIDVFSSSGAPALTGTFTDPTLPAGYGVFNVQTIGSQLFATYAPQDAAAEDEIAGPGNGVVDVFDLNGNFQQRFATGGALNAPWGVTQAPAGFGNYGGQIIIGNFADGALNVFDATTGNLISPLIGTNGHPLQIDGLWGIDFGNGAAAGPSTDLFFAAGPDAESHGLFGKISAQAVPDASLTLGLVLVGIGALVVFQRTHRLTSA